jgi:hypothetical protein
VRTRLQRHLTYANVMSTVAVFLALGGGIAWALANNSVKSKHIVNGQVKAVDIKDSETTPGSEAISAEKVGHFGENDLVKRSTSDPVQNLPVLYHSHQLDTTASATFDYGQVDLKTVGVADTIQVCNGQPGPFPVVIYLGATRTQETVAANSCTANKTIPDNGDFRVAARGTQIFGEHSGDTATSDSYDALAFTHTG